MYRTKEQNKTLHALLGELNIDVEQKEELVYQFTQSREKSSSKMLITECQAMINHLKAIKSGYISKNEGGKKHDENDPANKMRRKILSICYEMRWTLNGGIDWEKLNAWLYKYGYLKKDLNKYTEAELPTLVTQFENLLKTFYAKR